MASFCTKYRVFGAAVLVAASGSAIAANSPLPGFAQKTRPVVFFLLDTSGSMNACDGGEVLPSRDLTQKAGGGFLYNPLTDAGDDGACGFRPAAGPYQITRLEATKLSVSRILDADGNGQIDDGDEELLRLEVGVTNFPDFSDTNYDVGPGNPVGSSYADVWNYVRALRGSGGTPTGPALAGARARFLQRCYDGDNGSSCALDQNTGNGNDKGLACRDYYVVLLTDGEPNTDSPGGVGFDPLPVARALQNKQKVLSSEAAPAIRVRTFAIGLGADVTGIGSKSRGYINCTSYWGSKNGSSITDANKDGDGNAETMKATAGGTEVSVGAACNTDNGMNAAVKGLGNGYFATDSRELSDAFKTIMNAIQAGTYSRSEPTVSTGTGATNTGDYVFGSFFDVERGALDWRGHLRKYRFNGELGRYVDCDSPTTTSSPLKPCWDAGGWYGAANASPYGYKGLFERSWDTRRIFVVNPANVAYDPDLDDAHVTRPSSRTMPTVLNVVSRLPASYASPALPANVEALHKWAAMSELADTDSTYSLSDTVPNARLLDALQTLAFTAGRPTSTFSSGRMRCDGATCDDTTPSAKLGDSFNSRPAIVGPPLAISVSLDYNGEFLSRELDTYGGSDAPVVGNNPADPCDGERDRDGKCTVGLRRKVVYLPANDGMLHAFDAKTGAELWAFIPPGHMNRLKRARDGRTTFVDGLVTVRDVRFPCDREPNGECRAAQSRPFADGKWHTIAVVNQGAGGNFLFTLDVTNPVKPVFLWEFRKPSKMGNMVSRPVVAELAQGLPTVERPLTAVFAPGGYFASAFEGASDPADTTTHPHFFSLRVFDGEILDEQHIDPKALGDSETSPSGIVNAMTGAPAAVDGNLDGTVDRVYFGDREGRLWKAHSLTETGDFQLRLFFDPALYDVNNGGEVGRPTNATSPLSTADAPEARKTLRGPIFFAPDVTRDTSGKLLVAFGSGNLLDPLSAPGAYKNFVWVVQDEPTGSGSFGARASRCGAGPDRTYTAPGGKEFTSVLPMSELLTGAPLIFKGVLLYPEFDPDVDKDGDVCEDDYTSRVVAVDAFNCGEPGILPFLDNSNQPTAVKEYPGELVTGVQIDPRSGTLFTQASTGAGAPALDVVAEFGHKTKVLGRRQPQ